MLQKEPYADVDQWRQYLDEENKQQIIGKGIAQDIHRKLSLKAFSGGFKIALVLLPEFMNKEAANRLLKVLEEPEPNTVFLLVSTDADQLLATILSRAQLVKVPALRPTELVEALRERLTDLGEEEAMAIALRSECDLPKRWIWRTRTRRSSSSSSAIGCVRATGAK